MPEVEDKEVDVVFDKEPPVAPEPPPEEEEAKEEPKAEENPIEVIEPQAQLVPRNFKDEEGNERVYIQKPLGYFNKLKFFALVGKSLDDLSEAGGSLNVLANTTSLTDFQDVESFLGLAAKVAVFAPDFIQDCYCLWLDIPSAEQPWARAVMDESFDDDLGLDIINVFIGQNWNEMETFFREKVRRLEKTMQTQRALADKSQSSKRSNRTPTLTPKR